jgi:signal peptidase I
MQQEPIIPQQTPIIPDNNPTEQSPVVVRSGRSGEGWRSILSTILILIAAPIVAIMLTTYVFQSYEVDGPSMETTLQNHDRLIIWKAARTWSRIDHSTFIPKRGEIIVFNKKGLLDTSRNEEKQLIKRVIALPGERIVIKDGLVTVYNAKYPEGFNPDKGTDYIKSASSTIGTVDLVVPKGEVYVCGDNRGNSLDSRYFGPVPATDIVGTLVMRIFPVNKAEAF